MTLNMVQRVEGFGAVGALEGFLLRVEPLVNFEIALRLTNLPTGLTHEFKLVPCPCTYDIVSSLDMGPQVLQTPKVLFVGGAVPAETDEGVWLMKLFMCFAVLLNVEVHGADGAREFVGFRMGE